MPKNLTALLALLFTVACSTTTAPPASSAVATATIKAITPPADTEVSSTAFIEADIEYVIENFDPRSEYYLAPLFASNEGPGRTFNEFQRITDGWKLSQPSGTVHVRYSIAREWRSPSLAKPVLMNFKIMVRTGTHGTKVIGETETVRYTPVG
jgi:hypothetical protein